MSDPLSFDRLKEEGETIDLSNLRVLFGWLRKVFDFADSEEIPFRFEYMYKIAAIHNMEVRTEVITALPETPIDFTEALLIKCLCVLAWPFTTSDRAPAHRAMIMEIDQWLQQNRG